MPRHEGARSSPIQHGHALAGKHSQASAHVLPMQVCAAGPAKSRRVVLESAVRYGNWVAVLLDSFTFPLPRCFPRVPCWPAPVFAGVFPLQDPLNVRQKAEPENRQDYAVWQETLSNVESKTL